MGSVFYAELTPSEFEQRKQEVPVAYLPLGTLEWHGEHLPLGSDALQSLGFFRRLAEQVGGLVLPPLFQGPEPLQYCQDDYYGMDIVAFPEGKPQKLTGSAYYMPIPLFEALMENILHQLRRAGFSVVVAHGHGPSVRAFRAKKSCWESRFGLILMDCWNDEDEDQELGIQTDHAGANETSLMMAMYSELVHIEKLPPMSEAKLCGVKGKDPRVYASAELGERAIRKQLAAMKEKIQAALQK